MCMKDSIYISVYDYQHKYRKKENSKVIIWGTGEVAIDIYRTLEYIGISLYAFGDNNMQKHREGFLGYPVLDVETVIKLENPIVLIGSFVVRPIYEQLYSLGITDVYAIYNPIKYKLDEWVNDCKWIREDFKISTSQRYEEKILIEVYGNIGDVIIKLGLLDAIINKIGVEKVYFLVETQDIASIMEILSPNVIVLEKNAFIKNAEYRILKLKEINRLNFSKSIVIGDIRLHANRRLLDEKIFRCEEVIYHNILPDKEYLPSLDVELVKNKLHMKDTVDFSPKRIIDDEIKKISLIEGIEKKYVVVHMGATKEERHYSPQKMSKVLRYLREKNYEIAMIGYGSYDEFFYNELDIDLQQDIGIHNFIGKLSLKESFRVIQESEFFVGTDSGMWNASYVLDKPSVVLYGGGEFGNFMHNDSKIHYVITEKRECFGCRWFCTNQNEDGYARCIGDISPKMIIEKIDQVIGGLKE